MVERSTVDYQKHLEDVYLNISQKYDEETAKKFIDFYRDRYDIFNRSFMDYKLAFSLLDDYHYCKRIGTKWYAFVGIGGSGKSTTAKNVLYFLDKNFGFDSMATEIDDMIKIIDKKPVINAMEGVFLDEPDDSIAMNSKKGKIVRRIFGKIRQQKLFIGICATDLKDIPPYIYRKIDGIFFFPYLGKYMFFKNKPQQKSYVLQKIRKEYDDKGYQIFFELEHDKGCLKGDTIASTPLDIKDEEYLTRKREDFKKDMHDYLNYDKEESKEKKDDRTKIILNMKKKGLTDKEISEFIGLSRSRITQILRNEVNVNC